MSETRCYIIADDYRCHFVTDCKTEFYAMTVQYIELMAVSDKENTFYFRNVFLEKKELEIIQKNIGMKSKPVKETSLNLVQ